MWEWMHSSCILTVALHECEWSASMLQSLNALGNSAKQVLYLVLSKITFIVLAYTAFIF
jgi:hypothetical protein